MPNRDMHVVVTAVPKGEAPMEVRREWVGVRFIARQIPGPSTGTGSVTGDPYTYHDAWVVPKHIAIEALRRKSGTAADWFVENHRSGNTFIFEAECIRPIGN